MGTYKTSDFRKGLRIQIDGEPYLMVEMNFRKPGKGNALYECKMKNLVRGTTLTRTYKGGDTLESADVEETQCQYLYRQGETFVFMLPYFDAGTKSIDPYGNTEFTSPDLLQLRDSLRRSMDAFKKPPKSLAIPEHLGYGSTVFSPDPKIMLPCVNKTLSMIEHALAVDGTLIFRGD